jgi:ribosomal protein S4E
MACIMCSPVPTSRSGVCQTDNQSLHHCIVTKHQRNQMTKHISFSANKQSCASQGRPIGQVSTSVDRIRQEEQSYVYTLALVRRCRNCWRLTLW